MAAFLDSRGVLCYVSKSGGVCLINSNLPGVLWLYIRVAAFFDQQECSLLYIRVAAFLDSRGVLCYISERSAFFDSR